MMFFEHLQLFQLGFLAGTHLIAVLAGLVIALAGGERVWILYSVFATLSGLTLLFLVGLPGWLGGKSFPGLADTLQGVLLVLSVAAVIDFVARLTRTHRDYPRLYLFVTRAGWLLAVPASLCILAGRRYFLCAAPGACNGCRGSRTDRYRCGQPDRECTGLRTPGSPGSP